MAREIMSVPEENLQETITVILAGLVALGDTISEKTRDGLRRWCNEEQAYLDRNAKDAE